MNFNGMKLLEIVDRLANCGSEIECAEKEIIGIIKDMQSI